MLKGKLITPSERGRSSRRNNLTQELKRQSQAQEQETNSRLKLRMEKQTQILERKRLR